jgi:hypothetical protein
MSPHKTSGISKPRNREGHDPKTGRSDKEEEEEEEEEEEK